MVYRTIAFIHFFLLLLLSPEVATPQTFGVPPQCSLRAPCGQPGAALPPNMPTPPAGPNTHRNHPGQGGAPENPRPAGRSSRAIPCSVLGYEISDSIPTLNLVCPQKAIYAPLRVYLKMIWTNVEDVSYLVQHTLLHFGAGANLTSVNGQSRVELQLQDSVDAPGRRKWFDMNVLHVGLAKDDGGR